MSTAAGWPTTTFPPTGPPTAPSGILYDRAEEQVRDLIIEASEKASAADTRRRRAAHRRPVRQLPRRGDRRTPGRPAAARRAGHHRRGRRLRVTGRRHRRPAAHRGGRRRRRIRRHRRQELHPLPGAPHPIRPRTARRVLLPRRAARRGAGGLPGAHRADVRPGVRWGHRSDHAETAARIVALETKLAAAHWDVVKRRDADLTYNLRTFAELQTEARGLRLGRLGWRAGQHAGGGRGIGCAPTRLPDRLRRAVGQRGPRRLESAGRVGV